MSKFTTQFRAIDPKDGQLYTWAGPYIEAPSLGMAQKWCEENAGHLVVNGKLIKEVPCKEDGKTPDWENAIDWDAIENN